MEVLTVGCSQIKVGKSELPDRQLGFCKTKQICEISRTRRLCHGLKSRPKRGSVQVALKTIRCGIPQSEGSIKRRTLRESDDRVKFFVGLPLDVVSNCNTLNHTKAIAAALKALKLLGVNGVELPIWWGIVEKEAQGKYDWSAYLAVAEMVNAAGLEMRISICFHASTQPVIGLPQWVSQVGEAQPNIFFTDRSRRRYKGCLSLSVDELPVLNGNSPMQVFGGFLQSFKSSFSSFIGSTIMDISVSLGPNGELRYPSFQTLKGINQFSGVGEFQCYDQNMLNHLKQLADTSGNPYWGLSGPHDGPTYNESPDTNGFCKPHGGSWETPYGNFFLSWYSSQLVSHGDRVLSLASSTFSDSSVTISGKIPLLHSWYHMRSHPAELTAGYFNTVNRDGYEAVAEIFARNSCRMMLPGLELSDENVPEGSQSSPSSLVSQIVKACTKHGVHICGENSSPVSRGSGSFDSIKSRLSSSSSVNSFVYQRMGTYFFSPEHFPLFTQFVRGLEQSQLPLDDLPSKEEEPLSPRSSSETGKDLHMQAA